MESEPSKDKDCSLDEFMKTVLDAVALSCSSEYSGDCGESGECRDMRDREDTYTGSLTVNSEGSTTRLESNDGSTTRIGSFHDDGIGAECPTISLDESKVPDLGDPFEDVFYRTETGHSRTVFHFVSEVYYMRFRDKIMSDFSLTMNNDAVRCITHFRGLKCEMKIDNLTSTVTVSGVGHKIWREDFFPVVSRLLFAQYVKYADSHILERGTSRQRSGKGAIRKRFPLHKPRWEKNKPTIRYLYHETIVSRMGSYFPNRWPLSYLNLTKNMKTYIRRQQHKKFLNTKT